MAPLKRENLSCLQADNKGHPHTGAEPNNNSLYLYNIKFSHGYILALQKSKFCRGCTFSNAVKIMVFISDVQRYIPIMLCQTAGSIHLLKITGTLKAENIKLNKNYIWDTLEIDWKEVTLTFNGNEINLPRVVTIKL